MKNAKLTLDYKNLTNYNHWEIFAYWISASKDKCIEKMECVKYNSLISIRYM